MSLIKWSPFFFDSFNDMEKVIQKMSDEGASSSTARIVPPIDMYEADHFLIVETPMAGVDPKQVEIAIDEGVLSIKGKIERQTEVDEKNYYRKEVRSGSVFRQVALPPGVDGAQAEATFQNGVLKIRLPKIDGQKSIKVRIKE